MCGLLYKICIILSRALLPALLSLQQVFVPPPLIDPDVDIANDPAYAIRLMDILDQIASSSRSQSATASQDLVQVGLFVFVVLWPCTPA